MRIARGSIPCILAFTLASLTVPARPLLAQDTSPTVRSLLTGFGTAGYSMNPSGDLEHDFGASTSLVPLFQIDDDLLVEGGLELALHDGGTLVTLEHAELHYLGLERLQLTAGKFHVPFGVWNHANWVNRMPIPPTLYEDAHGEAPSRSPLPILFDLGAMARWTVPLAEGWRTSAGFWVTQGPRPGTAAHGHEEGEEVSQEEEAADAPSLAYGSNDEDNNANKMVGLQLRAVSAGGFTLQLSGFRAAYDEAGDLGVSAVNLSFIWTPRVGPRSALDVRGEGVLIDQEYLHHDELESVVHGGYYLQASRRIGGLEPVVRWSHLPRAVAGHAPLIERQRQLAIGLDYWLSPSVPVKAAYLVELDETDRIAIEWTVGF